MQAEDNQQNCSQVHRKDAPLHRKRSQLRRHQQKYAATILQRGDPSDTTRRITPRPHQNQNEADAQHHPHYHSVNQPAQPGNIPYDTTKLNPPPPPPTPVNTMKDREYTRIW